MCMEIMVPASHLLEENVISELDKTIDKIGQGFP